MSDPWAGVVGQDEAVSRLRIDAASPLHAYLFVGPPGSGRRLAARVFAGEIFAAGCSTTEAERHRRLAVSGEHADLVVVEPKGISIPVGERSHPEEGSARWLVQRASLSPMDASHCVYVLGDFHLVREAAPALLKTLEEPPVHVVFVIIADEITPGLVTIASRCAQVQFHRVPDEVIADRLRAEGIEAGAAGDAAAASLGSLDRARLLARDARLGVRRAAWVAVPTRLDGTPAAAAEVAAELRAHIDDAQQPLAERHAAEVAALEARAAITGERGSGRRELEARQRREVRKLRTDELRFGIATLAAAYRAQLGAATDPRAALAAIGSLRDASAALVRNPNEALLLQSLLLKLTWPGAG